MNKSRKIIMALNVYAAPNADDYLILQSGNDGFAALANYAILKGQRKEAAIWQQSL